MTAPLLALPGDAHVAFDHLAGYGLAAILEAAGHPVRLHWTDELDARLFLTGVDWDTAASAVRTHAEQARRPESWVMADGEGNGVSALFSPRVKAMSPVMLEKWYSSRSRFLADHASADALDLAMIGALGEPSYWNTDQDAPRPDNGASRWEMKTRNRGEEFVTHRLRPLAHSVADRTSDAVLTGLSGATIVDEVGKNSPDSRTPTGLTSPGPTDNARAWCALWGLSCFAVAHRQDIGPRAAVSKTAGHVGGHLAGVLFLPLVARPMSLPRLRVVLTSRQLENAAAQHDATPVADKERARTWLTDRGINAVLRFPVHRSANANAPEKWAKRGTLVNLYED